MRNLAKNSNVAEVLQAPLVPGPHQGAALCRFGKDRSQDPPPGCRILDTPLSHHAYDQKHTFSFKFARFGTP